MSAFKRFTELWSGHHVFGDLFLSFSISLLIQFTFLNSIQTITCYYFTKWSAIFPLSNCFQQCRWRSRKMCIHLSIFVLCVARAYHNFLLMKWKLYSNHFCFHARVLFRFIFKFMSWSLLVLLIWVRCPIEMRIYNKWPPNWVDSIGFGWLFYHVLQLTQAQSIQSYQFSFDGDQFTLEYLATTMIGRWNFRCCYCCWRHLFWLIM